MISGEWSLFYFTLLVQLAVGTWIAALLLKNSIAKKMNPELAAQLTGPALLLVGPAAAIALLISFFHLGKPMLAYGAIANLGSSWLSREILFVGLFMFFWIVAYYLNRRQAGAADIMGWITAVIGVLAVYSMASIYHFSSIPAWATINTYISFFATTIVLGSIATSALLGFSAKGAKFDQELVKLLLKLSYFALAAVVIQLIFVAVNIMSLKTGIGAAQSSAQLQLSVYIPQLILSGLLGIAGTLLFVIVLSKNIKQEAVVLPISAFYTAFLIILAGESLGRFLFYASAVPMGIR